MKLRLRLARWCLAQAEQAYHRGRAYNRKTKVLSSPTYYHLTNMEIFWVKFWHMLTRQLLK